ncbi:Mur ligase [Macrophomina phaseolina]|uniref:Mur ligase n=1 Tax=Macrophomina phaseolina TaxID=35725 RepID=A0ABQ8G193_9PEZI|nr:Mur ligase [Macrophomina phaseolina]
MKHWLHRIGHSTADIDNLNIIHVAGTKAKGSTCAFVDSFLRAFGTRTGFPRKTGLYTPPHLVYPKERIRIGFPPHRRRSFREAFLRSVGCLGARRQPVSNFSLTDHPTGSWTVPTMR